MYDFAKKALTYGTLAQVQILITDVFEILWVVSVKGVIGNFKAMPEESFVFTFG
jgi:hypothetical protein